MHNMLIVDIRPVLFSGWT